MDIKLIGKQTAAIPVADTIVHYIDVSIIFSDANQALDISVHKLGTMYISLQFFCLNSD